FSVPMFLRPRVDLVLSGEVRSRPEGGGEAMAQQLHRGERVVLTLPDGPERPGAGTRTAWVAGTITEVNPPGLTGVQVDLDWPVRGVAEHGQWSGVLIQAVLAAPDDLVLIQRSTSRAALASFMHRARPGPGHHGESD